MSPINKTWLFFYFIVQVAMPHGENTEKTFIEDGLVACGCLMVHLSLYIHSGMDNFPKGDLNL